MEVHPMDIHNSTEDFVLAVVHDICDSIEQEKKDTRPCTCYQCRLDAACYVLNRTAPKYVVSSRGAARAEGEGIERQQEEADIAALVYEGLNKIAQSRRPHFAHIPSNWEQPSGLSGPAYNIPTIIGRVFNGANFEPMSDIDVELHCCGKKATMMDPNWQNPYRLVPNTAGTFTFWPQPESAAAAGEQKSFDFNITISALGFEELHHFFQISIRSEDHATNSFSMQRTFKLPDLYLFPPGGEEDE